MTAVATTPQPIGGTRMKLRTEKAAIPRTLPMRSRR